MQAEQVVEKILADARAQAEEIKRQAGERDATEQAKLDEQLAEYKHQTETLAAKAADDERSHTLAAARMQIAKELLAEKTKILDEVFERARRKLRELPTQEYADLMARLVAEAVETGDEQILVDAGETRLDQDFVTTLNRRLGADKGNLRLSGGKHSLGGGVVLTRGKIRTNITFGVLLKQARTQLEIDLARELFVE